MENRQTIEDRQLMAKRIHSKRVEFGLTMEELGKKIGVQKQSISKWESGAVTYIKRDYINKMAVVFDVSTAWLMGLDDVKDVTITYSAPGREPIITKADGRPIIGPASKRAELYQAALQVKVENLDVAIQLLKSLS